MIVTFTELVAEALRLQPLMTIVLVTVVLSGIATSLPLVPVQPGAPLTVRLNVVVRVELGPVPVMVTASVPDGVDAEAAIVSVDVPPAELIEAGLKLAVAPDGRPDAVSATVCAEPLVSVAVIVLVTELPGLTEPPAPEGGGGQAV